MRQRNLEKELSELRDSVPVIGDRASSFSKLTGLLEKYAAKKTSPLQWRVMFTCLCIDVIRRQEDIPVYPKCLQEYQVKKEHSIVVLNMVVSELVPHMGAHALVLLLALEASSFGLWRLQGPGKRGQQAVAKEAAADLSKISIDVPCDQLWFHPAALIAWFMKDK